MLKEIDYGTLLLKVKDFKAIEQALLKAQEQEQVIKECIKLLSVDGENTKGKVKELLEGLVK